MHIPDGFVSEQINAATAVVSAGVVSYALWRVGRDFKKNSTDIMSFAMVSAFIFAAQMLNFSIGGGTSGHFLGAVFAAVMLGPWAACLSLSLVLAVQGFFFADGGIAAMGSNILNMGVIGGVLGYALCAKACRFMPKLAAIAVASWASIVMASAACAIELAASGTTSLAVALSSMVGTHALIGVGEGVIAVAAVTLFTSLTQRSEKVLGFVGLALAVVMAALSGPLASSAPDGLEKLAIDQGFDVAAQPALLAGDAAGVIGTLVVFGLAVLSAQLVARAQNRA